MKIIELPAVKDINKMRIQGAFTFFSAGDLIFLLETAFERAEATQPFEELIISCHFTFLDVRCKKICFNYINQLNSLVQAKPELSIIIEWEHDWFDDDIIEFGYLLKETCKLKFNFIELDHKDVVRTASLEKTGITICSYIKSDFSPQHITSTHFRTTYFHCRMKTERHGNNPN